MNNTLLIVGDPRGNHTLAALKKYSPESITVWEHPDNHYTIHQLCDRINVIDDIDKLSDMRFNATIGNPPYQKGKNSNFYVEFIDVAARHTIEGGRVSLIVPNRFILPHTPACKSILSQYKVSKMYVDVNKHFPGVGTKIGMFVGEVCSSGHTGLIDVELADGNVIKWDGIEPIIPSRNPTLDGINEWQSLRVKNDYIIVNKQPTDHDDFVYVCRQWKTQKGVPYFDAEVGRNDNKRDGKYILTEKPQELCNYLRSTDIAGKIHKLFGDQMNIWPFLWQYLPTCP